MLTRAGSPTKPRSTTRSAPVSASRVRRLSGDASMSRPSLPLRPTAVPPSALIVVTICLLMVPASTISTTSIAAASVTRRPSTKSLSMPRRASILAICGPPPWTTTGLMPTCFSSTTSRAKLWASAASPMAWPPYLMTTLRPAKRRM